MVRHGLLSPNSKLLPGATSRATTPMDERPGSIMSLVSNGVYPSFIPSSLLRSLFVP